MSAARVCTSTCEHDWKPIPGFLGHFKCAICLASGSRSVRTLAVPFNRNIKGVKTPEHLAARARAMAIVPCGCKKRVKRADGTWGSCGAPAYSRGGMCSEHAAPFPNGL